MAAGLRDMRFLIHEVFDFEGHYQRLNLEQPPGRELLDSILEEASRFTQAELAPLNQTGDVQGCQFDDGVVTTPKGFREAYAR